MLIAPSFVLTSSCFRTSRICFDRFSFFAIFVFNFFTLFFKKTFENFFSEFFFHQNQNLSTISSIFLTFLENYLPKFKILGSIEITDCANPRCISVYGLFYTKSYDSRKCQIFDLLYFFSTLFAKYPAKSDIISLIETIGCRKPIFITGYAQFV